MKNVLVIAPHPDDEVLGAGGTIKRLSDAGYGIYILTVAAHMPPYYSKEVHQQTIEESRTAHRILGVTESFYSDQPALLLRDRPVAEINRLITDKIAGIHPSILLMPFYDRHIDHRVVFDACMVASRPVGVGRSLSLVACYEAISETHWNAAGIEPVFAPNLTIDITNTIETKLKAMECFKSQLHAFPGPRSPEALKALALFRGSQAGFAYGEAFHIIRMTEGLFV
jgi:LmbE family N-acetylglucosaminyl deacetylase